MGSYSFLERLINDAQNFLFGTISEYAVIGKVRKSRTTSIIFLVNSLLPGTASDLCFKSVTLL